MNKYIELLDPSALPRSHEIFTKMRREDPIYYFDTDFFQSWIVTDYDKVSALLHDRRLSNSNTLRYIAAAPQQEQQQLQALSHYMRDALPEVADDRHKVLQKFFLQYFSPRVIADLRPRIEALTIELIAALDHDQEINFSRELCYPLPAMVIADILGAPRNDFKQIILWTEGLLGVFRPYDFSLYLQGQQDMLAMIDYCKALMQSGELRPDSLLAALKIEIDSGNISEEEGLVNCANILFAGHETTASALSKGLLEFYNNQDQWQLLLAEPSLLPSAVEEVMRKVGGLGWLIRTAKEDFNFHGHRINEGDRIILSPDIANADEKYFSQSDVFDIRRDTKVQHLAFGKGKHYCLGASLARMELEVALHYILSSFEGLHINLAGIEAGSLMLLKDLGLSNLPVTLNGQ